jgi:hypothetical protein
MPFATKSKKPPVKKAAANFSNDRLIFPFEFAEHIQRLSKASLKVLEVGRRGDDIAFAAMNDLAALSRVLHDYLVAQRVAYDDENAPGSRGAKIRLASLRKKLLALDEEVTLRHKVPTRNRATLA